MENVKQRCRALPEPAQAEPRWHSHGDQENDKTEKWPMNLGPHSVLQPTSDPLMVCDPQDNNLAYRYPTLGTMNLSPQITNAHPSMKPKKQDAIMQTDPVQSEEDDSQPNNSYSEVSEKYPEMDYPNYQKQQTYDKKYEAKDYTNKQDDYIPQTNEEYNKEAEKYALERKSLNGYDKPVEFPKQVDGYPKLDAYPSYEKPFRPEYGFQNYQDSVEMLRNQQHNLQMLQEQHRINENQNFFNERQNTMKRPFFYSESPHYNSTPILHRYEDISRILQ
ncbi:hypothetical protein HF086_007649 [Spodoptera exigua]|uniref:Uncharacterized protein n=1 Tax=Spodoptera exigua TaxID=7107 RepID=A0A922SD37_SPOEX|nr:hypothetical protein HF086_007649 [Spodoptera exigua]